jgi:hypothetical protein
MGMNPGPDHNLKLKCLSICHANIRGISDAKINAIKTSLCKKFEIITLSETFLSPQSASDLCLPGYHSILRRDRPTFGGGVAMFIKENIAYKRKCDYECNSLENMWIEVITKEGKLLICTIYRPPNNATFWEQFESNIEYVKSESAVKNMIILGDLNADFSTANGKKLLDICRIQNLRYHINEPTRITATSRTCLDQILSNIPQFVSSSCVFDPVYTNDHCTVGVDLTFKIASDPAYTRHVWIYEQGDYDGFRHALNNANWDECFVNNDVNEACAKWTDKFLNIAKTYIPNRTVLIRPRDSPWFTSELRQMKRKLIRLYRKAKANMNDNNNNWIQYKQFKIQYHERLSTAQINYEKNLCQSLREDKIGRKWWSTIKQFMGKGNNQSYPPIFDTSTNSYAFTSKEKATVFNNFFLSHSNIDDSNARLPDDDLLPDVTLDNVTATEQEVSDLIHSLDVSKATGHDGISAKLLKRAGQSIVPSLTNIINLCLSQSEIPNEWKKAEVIPLHKKETRDNCNNYRPVSILPIASKILERVVFKHLYNYFFENNLLTPHNSGFKPGDSTVNQLAFLYHTFCEALDMKKDIKIVFCDISKAFDRVWFKGIIYKLRRLGISGNLLNFFKNYLLNRKQRVILNGQHSEWGNIKAGVPQGSVLGPLLFLVYINDLADNITCNVKLFADDTVLYTVVENPETSAELLNYNLEIIDAWSKQWLVTFNPTKTKLMNITLKKNADMNCHPLYFGGTTLNAVSNQRHLGLEFTNNLKWSTHIDKLIENVSTLCDIMQKLKRKLDRKTLEHIYFSFIRPKLEYGSIIWDDCSQADEERLENMQLRFARTVTGAKRGTSHGLLYKETGWPKLSDRRNFFKLKFIHRIFNHNAPDYLCNLLPVTNENSYNLRRRERIKQFHTRTEKFRKSLFPDCIRRFNNLPEITQNVTDSKGFASIINFETKPNSLFYGIDRNLGIIHAQFRMNCSNLNAHLHLLHVIDDPSCICSNSKEDCKHFFFHCPLYNAQRVLFLNALSLICTLPINTHLLLYGCDTLSHDINMKIFNIVEMYIRDSERFPV